MNTAWKIAAISLMALLFAGTAVAQQQQGESGQADVEPDQMMAEFEQGSANGILDEDIEQLGMNQMADRGESKLSAMRVTLESTTELLEEARQEDRDILKINCINENLASIRGFVNVGEESYESLTEAADGNDQEAARHHYTLVAIAHQRVTGLGEQARVCAGEELRYAEDAVLEVSVDPEVGDPDDRFVEDDQVLERLPELTPHQ